MNYSQPPTPFMRASKQLIQSVCFFFGILVWSIFGPGKSDWLACATMDLDF
jgi:hypothetical protein